MFTNSVTLLPWRSRAQCPLCLSVERNQQLASNRQNSVDRAESDFRDQTTKSTETSSLFSWVSSSSGSLLLFHLYLQTDCEETCAPEKLKSLQQELSDSLRVPDSSHTSEPSWKQILQPGPSEDLLPYRYPSGNLLRDPEYKPPRRATLGSYPTEMLRS